MGIRWPQVTSTTCDSSRTESCLIFFVGLYGDPASDVNRRVVERANAMRPARRGRRELKVDFYDSESAHVWLKCSTARQSSPKPAFCCNR